MCETQKQDWVCAILLERLKYAIKEECEIFFSFFIHDLHGKFHHIHNKESALKFWRQFSTRPSGGDTDLGMVVNKIKNMVPTGRFFNLDVDLSKDSPEILSIGDGQDTVKTNGFTYKTNSISLCQGNSELKNLCKKNKGVYVHIDHDNTLHISE